MDIGLLYDTCEQHYRYKVWKDRELVGTIYFIDSGWVWDTLYLKDVQLVGGIGVIGGNQGTLDDVRTVAKEWCDSAKPHAAHAALLVKADGAPRYWFKIRKSPTVITSYTTKVTYSH